MPRLLLLLLQGWLGRSDYLIHQGEGAIRAVTWHSSTLVWANDVGLKVGLLGGSMPGLPHWELTNVVDLCILVEGMDV